MLAETTLARPYARAAFNVADQAGTADAWSGLLARAAAAVGSDAFAAVIGHPKIDDKQLMTLFGDVLGEASEPAFDNFLKILMHYRRLPLLPEIAAQFETLKRARDNRLKVNITSAVALESDQLESITRRLRERFGRDIELATGIDESLIGGFVVRAGDKVIDASVRGRLRQLGRNLVR